MTTPEIDLTVPRFGTDVATIGGVIKQEFEDFEVQEIPAYPPSGHGEHVMLLVEKTDLTGEKLVRRIARSFDIDQRAVGTAGTKDRRAVTRQWITVQWRGAVDDLPDPGDGIRILDAARHDNRIKTGHLQGNRFRIRIRETTVGPDGAAETARATLSNLSENGMPNVFGPQRFGREGDTARWGLGLLLGEKRLVPFKVMKSKSLRRFALSAVQSAVYNRYLVRRVEEGLFGRAMVGDVMKKTDTGGTFNASPHEMADVQARLDAGEIVHAGPIFGKKTFKAHKDAEKFEDDVLTSLGLERESFMKHGKLMPGTRRPDIVRPTETDVETTGDGIIVSFSLRSGSYATVLLRELMG